MKSVQGHGSAAGFRPGDVFADNAADHNRKIARATRLTTPSALTVLRERSLSLIAKESSEGMRTSKDHGVTRQKFLGTTIRRRSYLLAGGSQVMTYFEN